MTFRDSNGMEFRTLSPEEEEEFRQWARDNFDSGKEANPLWHPVVRDEWAKLLEKEKMLVDLI